MAGNNWPSGIGQDSHAFITDNQQKPLVLGGVTIPGSPGLAGNSDADVILHALCNAVSSITGKPFLGEKTDAMCKAGITDSAEYVKAQLQQTPIRIGHIAISIEAKKPKLTPWFGAIKNSIAKIASIQPDNIGLTATTGEGLTSCGRGEGIMATVIISASLKVGSAIMVFISCDNQQTAKKLSSGLIEQRLAACVQETAITSTFSWEGRIHHENERLLIVKTREELYPAIEQWVTKNHPYKTPEIITTAIHSGLPDFLSWIMKETS